jgi:hypothetical protein
MELSKEYEVCSPQIVKGKKFKVFIYNFPNGIEEEKVYFSRDKKQFTTYVIYRAITKSELILKSETIPSETPLLLKLPVNSLQYGWKATPYHIRKDYQGQSRNVEIVFEKINHTYFFREINVVDVG